MQNVAAESKSSSCEQVAAIVLAAGLSRRMGRPKAVLPWKGTTVIEHIVRQLLEAGIKEVLVVSGGAHREIDQALRESTARILFNPAFAGSEMLDSIQLGLKNVSAEAKAALIVLGDQPQMKIQTIQQVVDAYTCDRHALVVPSFRMRRGHPWLVDRSLWPSILKIKPPGTLRSFLNEFSSEICYVECPDDTILRDLDTPADYAREQELN